MNLIFWKDAMKIKLGDRRVVLKYLINAKRFLLRYVDREDFVFMALETALVNNMHDLSMKLISFIGNSSLKNTSRFLLNKAIFLSGNSKHADIEETMEIYHELSTRLEDRKYRALSLYEMNNMKYKEEKIDLEEYIRMLEGMRFAYRDSDFEMNLLHELGVLYKEKGDYYKSLTRFRELTLYYPKGIYVISTIAEMSKIFQQSFIGEDVDEIQDYEAMRVFYDFKELIPVGRDGIDVVLNVIKRSINLDLLSEASELLEHLVKFRLDGEEKLIQYLNLGELYLRNNNHMKAKTIVTVNDFSDLPSQYEDKFLSLKARVLLMDKSYNQALETIFEMTDFHEKDDLLLVVYLNKEDWHSIIPIAEKELEYRDDPKAPLTSREKRYLRSLAAAYAFVDENDKLQTLRKSYKGIISDDTMSGRTVEIFDALSQDIDIYNFERYIDTDRIQDMVNSYDFLSKESIQN